MPGRVLQVEPTVPDLNVPRAWPCQAKTGTDLHVCGATPTALFRRLCAHRHRRDAWLCPTHVHAAGLIGTCDQCATDPRQPHRCPIGLIPVPAA